MFLYDICQPYVFEWIISKIVDTVPMNDCRPFCSSINIYFSCVWRTKPFQGSRFSKSILKRMLGSWGQFVWNYCSFSFLSFPQFCALWVEMGILWIRDALHSRKIDIYESKIELSRGCQISIKNFYESYVPLLILLMILSALS